MENTSEKKYVCYMRVSTQRQGVSGLGLEGQRVSAQAYLKPGDKIISEYIEIESGRKNDRPQLQAALVEAKSENATLLIAKLDRLARNVAFIANLLEAGVEIAAVDLPQANRFVLHIMAAVGEQEAKAISERTVAALAVAKSRGKKLGWANPARVDHASAVRASQMARAARSREFARRHGPRILERRQAGATYEEIAHEFNLQKIQPPRSSVWWPATVRNVLIKFDDAGGENNCRN